MEVQLPGNLPDPFDLSCEFLSGGYRHEVGDILLCEVECRSAPHAKVSRLEMPVDKSPLEVEFFGLPISISCLERSSSGFRFLLEGCSCAWEVRSAGRRKRIELDAFGYGPKLDSTLIFNGKPIARIRTTGRWYTALCEFSSGARCFLHITPTSDGGTLLRNWVRLCMLRWRTLQGVSPLISRIRQDDPISDFEAWSGAVASFLLRRFCVDHLAESG